MFVKMPMKDGSKSLSIEEAEKLIPKIEPRVVDHESEGELKGGIYIYLDKELSKGAKADAAAGGGNSTTTDENKKDTKTDTKDKNNSSESSSWGTNEILMAAGLIVFCLVLVGCGVYYVTVGSRTSDSAGKEDGKETGASHGKSPNSNDSFDSGVDSETDSEGDSSVAEDE